MGKFTEEQINKEFGIHWWEPAFEFGVREGKSRVGVLLNKRHVNEVIEHIDKFIDMFGSSILKANLRPQWPPRNDYDDDPTEIGDASYQLAALRRLIIQLDKSSDELIDKVWTDESSE